MMTLIVSGQEFQVRSFRLAANDISAVKYQRLDLNGQPCALIKVGLGVQGAKFPGTEVVGDVKFDTGEYWVYVVDGTKKLKVMHNNYTPLYIDFSDYPEQRLEGGRTYVLLLNGAKSDDSNADNKSKGNFLIMNVSPSSARVSIDNGGTTVADSDGSFKIYLTNGTHSYMVEAGDAYSPVSGTVEMNGERITLPITLNSLKASLTVKTITLGSKIYINEDYKGIDQWQGSLSPGTYLVEVKKDGYRSYSTTVSLAKQQSESLTIPALQASYGTLLVDYKPIDAEVYLDNNLLGKVPNVFDNILAGKHTIKISKDGYSDYTGSVTIQENQQAIVSGSLTKKEYQGESSDDSQKIYATAEVMPSFPGGTIELFTFLSQNIKYPAECEKKGIGGRVSVSFVINKDGSVSDVEIVKSVHELIDQEAVRVVSSMPKWIPGKQKGEPVRVKYEIPVTFTVGR